MKKKPKKKASDKPAGEMTEAEKLAAWRRQRQERGALSKPGKKLK